MLKLKRASLITSERAEKGKRRSSLHTDYLQSHIPISSSSWMTVKSQKWEPMQSLDRIMAGTVHKTRITGQEVFPDGRIKKITAICACLQMVVYHRNCHDDTDGRFCTSGAFHCNADLG